MRVVVVGAGFAGLGAARALAWKWGVRFVHGEDPRRVRKKDTDQGTLPRG